MSPSAAVVGIADHYARAVFVTVAVADGIPAVVDRRRVKTLDEGLPTAPYHHESLELALPEAEVLVDRVRRSAKARSAAALRMLRDDLAPDYVLKCVALRDAPAFPMPDTLAEILASRRVLYAADGEMYRRALQDGADALGLDVRVHARGKPVATEDVLEFVATLRRELGPPWQKDHKTAAAAAISALAGYS